MLIAYELNLEVCSMMHIYQRNDDFHMSSVLQAVEEKLCGGRNQYSPIEVDDTTHMQDGVLEAEPSGI
jgi:hypothetical protein